MTPKSELGASRERRDPPRLPPRTAWPWLLGGMAVGLGLGGFAGWRLASGAPPEAGKSAAVSVRGEGPVAPAPFREAAQAREAAFQKAAALAESLPLGENLRDSLRALEKVDDPEQRRLAWQAFLHRLPKERWGEMYKAVEEYRDFRDDFLSLENLSLFSLFAEHISLVDPAAALLRQGEEENPLGELGSRVFELWVGRDLAAAEAFFHSIDQEKEMYADIEADELASRLARAKAKTDPQAALAWVGQIPKDLRGSAYDSIFGVLSRDTPAEAARLFASVENWPGKSEAAHLIANRWAETEPEKALHWAEALPPGEALQAVFGPAEALAAKDFDAAWALVDQAASPIHVIGLLQGLAKALPEGKEADFAAALARTAIDDTLAAVARFDEPRLVHGMTDTLMRPWVSRDAEAASGWLAGLPQGGLRDAAIASFVGEITKSGEDAAAAAEWAAVIGADSGRASSLRRAVTRWADNDHSAARAWVQQTPRLTPEDRERLLPLTLKPPR